MALGVVQDPQFGPLVMVAAGGVLIETFGDRRLALPPLDEARASKLIDRLDVRPLLDGVRAHRRLTWPPSPGPLAALPAGRGPRGPHRRHRRQPGRRRSARMRGGRRPRRAPALSAVSGQRAKAERRKLLRLTAGWSGTWELHPPGYPRATVATNCPTSTRPVRAVPAGSRARRHPLYALARPNPARWWSQNSIAYEGSNPSVSTASRRTATRTPRRCGRGRGAEAVGHHVVGVGLIRRFGKSW